MLTLGALVVAGGLVTGQWQVAEAGGRLPASVALATAVKTAVKRVVVRTRPHVLADGGRSETGWGGRVRERVVDPPGSRPMLWDSKEAVMAWIRLLEDGAPEGEEAGEELEVLSLPDVGDRIAIHRPEGDVVVFEVLGRTFEVVVDEDGDTVGEERVTLDVERLRFVPDEEEPTPEQSH